MSVKFFSTNSIKNTKTSFPVSIVSGGTLSSDSTYYYRTFTSNGTLSVSNLPITIDVLVIAGGASGGAWYAGGGGAGGVCYHANRVATVGNYSITIGAGGSAVSGASYGTQGGNSTFDNITALGGGAGGYWNGTGYNGANGGSGGGGGMGSSHNTITYGGSATQGSSGGAVGYGNNGGGGWRFGGYYVGGGGGGAGEVGGTSNGAVWDTSGGDGLNTWSSWATATGTGVSGYYAGGGGASMESTVPGPGGLGGGGEGAVYGSRNPGNAVVNTGSGGGGQVTQGASGSGGSGIVIVRYLKTAVQLWHIGQN